MIVVVAVVVVDVVVADAVVVVVVGCFPVFVFVATGI